MPGGSMGPLDSMVMAGKEAPSEQPPVLLAVRALLAGEPNLDGQMNVSPPPVLDTTIAVGIVEDANRVEADREQLRRYVDRMLGHDALASQS